MTSKEPDPAAPDPADALLADLLAGLEGEGPRLPGPDAGRVAGHLAGVGDARLLEDASHDPAIRRLLADVVREVPLAEREAADRPVLPEGVRGAALSAWAADARAVGADLRALGRGRALVLRFAAAAAVLAVGLVGWHRWTGREAEAGLAVEAIERVDAQGAVTAEGPRRLALGERVRTVPGELVSLALAGGGRVVVRGGSRVAEGPTVACADAARDARGGCARPALAFEEGEALVVAPSDPRATVTPVVLPDGSRLEVVAGAARLEVGGGAARVEMDEAGRGRWSPREGAPIDLAGPGARTLGPSPAAAAAPRAPTLAFADLRWFGVARRAEPTDRFVDARRWRVVAGPLGGVRRTDVAGSPALAFDLAEGGEARVAWRPDDAAGAARVAVVRLLVRPGAAAARDARASSARLRLALVGVPGAEAVLDAGPGAATEVRRVEVPLPPGWAAGGADAVLRLVAEGRAHVEVLGVAFPSPFAPGDAVAVARGP